MANRFFPSYEGYKITSPFGMRTLNGTTRMHNGIDLVAKTNSGGSAVDYIKAHTGGTVTAAGYDSGAGYLIKIQTAPGVVMVYYHLRDKPTLKVGDRVETGDIIGYMGATGNVTGAHLHFGIQVNGSWVDPAPYLDCDYTAKAAVKTVSVELPILRKGDSGESVEALQILLKGRGYHLGSYGPNKDGIDGHFGEATENALTAFQEDMELEHLDGIAGGETWPALLGAR